MSMVNTRSASMALLTGHFVIDYESSGLGVPGRRYSLGGFTGAFRFLGRVNLQPYILVALPNTAPSSSTEEFVLEQLKGLVDLLGP